jgi:predicted polyphosphate/ATP-dependent NAD kinase
MSSVGIIANPASGKDIRRLVAFGSVFDNEEKVRIVRRVLLGLAAIGVARVSYMPDSYGIVERALSQIDITIIVSPTPLRIKGEQEDSTKAAGFMAAQQTDCIVTLGGDGTNRAVVKGSAAIPILPISTGTNNVFPAMIEGTLAGMAAGLVAEKIVPLGEASYHSTMLRVDLDGKPVDLALVDAAVYDDVFIGSRAVWDIERVRQIFLSRAEPNSIGLSSIGGVIHPVSADAPNGLYLEIGDSGTTVTAPVAPGIIQSVGITKKAAMKAGKAVPVPNTPAVLALDGEREVEILKGQQASVCLVREGPVVIDVGKTMTAAVKRKGFTNFRPRK